MPPDAPTVETRLFGYDLLTNPVLNKGTAFSSQERDEFELHGLLPPHVGTLELQVSRRLEALRSFGTDLERYAFLRELQDTNETLFYALLAANLGELLPIVYTPTVGLGCQQFSRLYRRPRGLFLSPPLASKMDQILANPRFDTVEAIVVTDGERILGLGDQGAGGMGIPIGKLALYTSCGGLHPETTLPVVLDVGTDNEEFRIDPLYVGWRAPRVRGQAYDDFVEAFVAAIVARWPRVLLQWEDFAGQNATRLLDRYRDRLCTFNDDVQGTAAVTTATLLAAVEVTGTPLVEQRVAVLGAGSAGCGISGLLVRAMMERGLSEREARARFYLVDRAGLLLDGMPGLLPFQAPFARDPASVAGWTLGGGGVIGLADVARNVPLTALVGVSGQAGGFTEETVRLMASKVARPVIFPLSNPTSRSEATPADLLRWTDERAIIGTGSPFPPVVRRGLPFTPDQTNNSYVFPGVGLGLLASGARRCTDTMFLAAAEALAALSPSRRDRAATLLPPIDALREVAFAVACAVGLRAMDEGHAERQDPAAFRAVVEAKMWSPRYRPYRRVR